MRRAAEGTHKGGGGGDRPRHKRGLLHSALTPAAATGWMQAPEPERSLGAYSQEKRTQQERREELKRGRVRHVSSTCSTKKRRRVLKVSSLRRGHANLTMKSNNPPPVVWRPPTRWTPTREP